VSPDIFVPLFCIIFLQCALRENRTLKIRGTRLEKLREKSD